MKQILQSATAYIVNAKTPDPLPVRLLSCMRCTLPLPPDQLCGVCRADQVSEGAALETVLCVDLVTIDRSLSLLTRVLICWMPRVARTEVDLSRATRTSRRLNTQNRKNTMVPTMMTNRTKPSTHWARALSPWSTSRKYKLTYITSTMLPAANTATHHLQDRAWNRSTSNPNGSQHDSAPAHTSASSTQVCNAAVSLCSWEQQQGHISCQLAQPAAQHTPLTVHAQSQQT